MYSAICIGARNGGRPQSQYPSDRVEMRAAGASRALMAGGVDWFVD